MMKMRVDSLDVAKGIGIWLVVLGHVIGQHGLQPYSLIWVRNFLYQFHVPLFFFLSGIFFNPEEKWKPFLVKKIKRLYLPFVMANLVFLGGDIVFRSLNGVSVVWLNEFKHAIKIVLGIGLTPMGGATWFLIALLRAFVGLKLLHCLCRGRKVLIFTFSFFIGMAGSYTTCQYGLGSSMVALMFLCSGFLCSKQYEKCLFFTDSRLLMWMFVSFFALILMQPWNSVDISRGLYENRLLALVGSYMGIMFVLLLSYYICKWDKLKKLYSFYGRFTMPILIAHFAAFKSVIIIQIVAHFGDTSALLAHPCYDVSGHWAYLYFIMGILLPLVPWWPQIIRKCFALNK